MTSSLPTGTVTFLFTDIEGSTELWEKHPQAMQVALAQHDALLRRVCAAHTGYVFKTVGDAFCVAFASPAAAVAAALEAQRALQQAFEAAPTAQSSTVALRVRMGLHTGAAEERDRDYFGQPLNRVARLMSAGHGGQILLSSETAEAMRDQLASAIALRDMGKHRLKGLAQLEQLFQVLAPDLPADFPKLNTSDLAYNNLPTQLTHFIGREKEVADVKRQLTEARLVTLSGSGGCGKTRLAIHVAGDVQSDFTHGVWLVELAPLADPALVPQTIIATFNLREDSQRTTLQVLIDYLRT